MGSDINKKVLSFEKIMQLSKKASKYLTYTYKCDFNLAEEKALDVWVENKEQITILADFTDSTKKNSEKEVYYLFKDAMRKKLGIYQTRNSEGKRIWYSPYFEEDLSGYDTCDEDYQGLEELNSSIKKEIFYEHINDFDLTKNEKLFIDLTFGGFNYRNNIDVLVFKEALNTDSDNYIKTFMNRLCKKLTEQSIKLGLR